MAKATKTQARELIDEFDGVLRNRNGGTRSENARMAPDCLARLKECAAKAAELEANAGKLLKSDEHLWKWITVIIQSRPSAFADQYGLEL